MNRVLSAAVLGFAVLAGSASGDAEAAIAGVARSGVITAVRDIDTPGDDSVLHNGTLASGVLAFVDRSDQRWAVVPQRLHGADYIQSAQNNADVTDELGTTMEMEVDVVAGTILHMFIDTRDPIGSLVPFPWMSNANFGADWIDSGEEVLGGGLGIDGVTFRVWSTANPLDAGTYTFRQQPVDGSFYGIAATSAVPEPGTASMVGLCLAMLVARRSRNSSAGATRSSP